MITQDLLSEIMKNIHVLPTDKASRLFYNVGGALLFTNYENHNGVNIYITSDEPAYPYAFHITNQEVLKVRAVGYKSLELYHDKGFSYPDQCKKIILTTDQDLIKDGVQAIDDEFLEWFIKNPSCESVEVEIDYFKWRKGTQKLDDVFKIIIPKEEAKQEIPQIGTKEFNDLASAYFGGKPKQEILEEAAQRIFSDFGDITRPSAIKRALELAKWQQERMYSEEDMKEAFSMGRTGKTIEDFNIKFKNK